MQLFVELLRLLVCAGLVNVTLQYCYSLKLLSYRTSESPAYGFVMHMLSSVTSVREEVPLPLWNICLVQHSNVRQASKSEPPKILYNSTYKVCEFWRSVMRVGVFNNVALLLFTKTGGNMSLNCPLAVGTYVMKNIHVPPDTGMLRLMYWPNTLYTLFGTVYSLLPDKSLEKKAHYEINATVLKSC